MQHAETASGILARMASNTAWGEATWSSCVQFGPVWIFWISLPSCCKIPLVSGNNSSSGWCMYPYRWFYPRIGSFQNREGVIPLSPSNSTLIWQVDEVSFWMHEFRGTAGFKISAFQSWPPKPSLSWTLNILRREAWGLIPEVVSRAWQRRVVLALAMLWCA